MFFMDYGTVRHIVLFYIDAAQILRYIDDACLLQFCGFTGLYHVRSCIWTCTFQFHVIRLTS